MRLDSSPQHRYMRAMHTSHDTGLPFMKMHGLGNDFVVLDARVSPIHLSTQQVVGIAHRHMGVGFDQLAVIESAPAPADAHLVFYNADGSTSAACGNATRCIAQHIMTQNGKTSVTLTTEFGTLPAVQKSNGIVSVNMGQPETNWQKIPLVREMDTDALPIDGQPIATNMGNPHCTFFVEDADAIDLSDYGAFETHPFFPERTNVQVVSQTGASTFRVRVWERGVGPTLASGSSACAVACAAIRTGKTDGRQVRLDMDGGTLHVDWADDGIWMSGPTAHVFSGTFTPEFLSQFT